MTNLRAGLIGALVLALASSGCGSSTSTSTAPSTVPRCSVSLPTPGAQCAGLRREGHRCRLDQSRVRVDGKLHGLVVDDQRSGERARRRHRRIRRDREQRSHQPPRRDRVERSASEHHPGRRRLRDAAGGPVRELHPCGWLGHDRGPRIERDVHLDGCVRFQLDHNSIGRERHGERHRGVRRGSGNRRTAHGHCARGRPSFLHHAISKLHLFGHAHELFACTGRWFHDRERLDCGGLSVDGSEQRAVGDGRAGGDRHRAGCRAGRG